MRSFFQRPLLDAVVLVLLSIGMLFANVRTVLRPHDAAAGVAVVFAPWTSTASALARATQAGGTLLSASPSSFVALVMPNDPDYAARVLDDGAWLVVDLQRATACLSMLVRS